MDDFASLFPFEEVDVRECRPRLRAILLAGGSAEYFDGTNTRVLDAGRALQPLMHTTPMPGLLRLVQPLLAMATSKYIQLEFYAGQKGRSLSDKPIWEHLYKRSELATAIEQFLQGASPTDFVQLWRAL
jgi:hypothetical protein